MQDSKHDIHTGVDDNAVVIQQRKGSSGIKGIIENPYVFAVALFASLGGVLFGYDQGVISGVQEMETFMARFPMDSTTNGLVVSILELGAWVGAWIVGYFADKISRKYSIVLFSVVFLLGSSIQGGAQNVGYMFGGRFVTGMAVGALSMLVPLYQSEIAPPEIRGSLVSLQQQAVTFGILISFWIDYGTQFISNEAQWRVPLCLQIAIGVILGVGILFFPFSPRWLASVGRDEESLRVLAKLRRVPVDDPLAIAEWREIKATVEFDRRVQAEMYPDLVQQGTRTAAIKVNLLGYVELFRKGMFNRLFIACAIMFFQQFVGVNALIYYAPKIFQSVGLTGDTVSLLATGVVGIINFVLTVPTVLFLDSFGRKPMLLAASAFMTCCMIIIAVIVGMFSDDWENHTKEGWVAVVFVYIFIANFAYSWGPIGWVYGSEIFPLRARAKAMSISTSANWMCNFIIGLITPPMLDSIGYGTYVFFGCFCFISFFFVLFLVPETKGRTLEEMDAIFGGNSAAHDAELMAQVQQDVAAEPIPGVSKV
ncbi:general substrate transporter [Zychaea mexicana]|uniref:general substrate transporter n=1 Tax=Zychaea mexicana TaxID=64656 RepID=UPI0022FDD764|nr:general substrate transporter [Zychaea mexicana]KAI9492037.1 general substrate transporter [Zychaea mexicana]